MGQGVCAIGAGQVVEARETLLVATISDGDVHQPALVDLVVVHRIDPAHPNEPVSASHMIHLTPDRLKGNDSVSSTKCQPFHSRIYPKTPFKWTGACILNISLFGCILQGSVLCMHTRVWPGQGKPTSRRNEHDLRNMQITFKFGLPFRANAYIKRCSHAVGHILHKQSQSDTLLHHVLPDTHAASHKLHLLRLCLLNAATENVSCQQSCLRVVHDSTDRGVCSHR